MANTKKTGSAKKRRPALPIPLYDLPGKGEIDPELIWKAVVTVIDRRRKAEAEAKRRARARAQANGAGHEAEGK